MDYPHIASLACPKPMLFVSGKQDRLFPIAGVEAAYDVMHQVWKSQGADAKLSTFILDQPHECNLNNQQAILEFMKENL